MKDLIIVGRGLASCVLAHALRKKELSYTIIGKKELSLSSRVAAGIWNPVVFKRMTKSWMADRLIPYLKEFYDECGSFLKVPLTQERELFKIIASESEKTFWMKRSRNEMDDYLEQKFRAVSECGITGAVHEDAGKVMHAGNLNIPLFLDKSEEAFIEHIQDEVFDHLRLQVSSDHIRYKEITAKGIVFCEGHLINQNPYFRFVKMKAVKGEVLTIRSEHFKMQNAILNKDGFIMDVANGHYKVGATYNWDDLTDRPTEKGKEELILKLQGLIRSEYSIQTHEAGVRPSTIDRRPVIGPHHQFHNVFVFNGLGTKGVMLAPYFADNFVNFFLKISELHPEANISRFYPHP